MNSETQEMQLTETRRNRSFREIAYKWFFILCSSVTIFATFGIIVVLLSYSLGFFEQYSAWAFLTGTEWSPTIKPVHFGVLPLVSGTLIITFGSALIALPIGVGTAIYLSEFASTTTRSIIKPILEILAGIPTVVYGYFALVYITPALQYFWSEFSTFNATSGAVVVGVMIIPFVSSMSEDAMNAVPDELRQAGYGMGATKHVVVLNVVFPAAISGIISSFILAFSRAIGETMAVTIAAGMNPQMIDLTNPQAMFTKPIETMTAAMVNLGMSDVSGQSLAYQSLFAVGLLLFCITFVMNLIGDWISFRYREYYQ